MTLLSTLKKKILRNSGKQKGLCIYEMQLSKEAEKVWFQVKKKVCIQVNSQNLTLHFKGWA